jgi:DNA polymerase delta subunit 1
MLLVGRGLIDKTKALVEAHYCVANGYAGNATVVYGDTDSVMIRFAVMDEKGPDAVKQAFVLAKDAAQRVSQAFPEPVKLEFEKVYRPYMLFSKKRYAGLLYSSSHEKFDYLDSKGLQNVRRDSCSLLREMYSTALSILLIQGQVDAAINYVKGMVTALLSREVSLHKLIISKKLTRPEYKGKALHAELAKRLAKIDPAAAPQVGDRVSYVIIENTLAKEKGLSESAEDPLTAIDRDLPINVAWYISNQLRKPLTQLFSLVMADPDSLFEGAHTRSVKKGFNAQSALMRNFVTVRARCLGCNCAVSGGAAMCPQCAGHADGIRHMKAKYVSDLSSRAKVEWDTCVKCAGGDEFAKMCRNSDCDTFYLRHLTSKQLTSAESDLRRFDIAASQF